MSGNNLRTQISYRNTTRDYAIYNFVQNLRDKSSFIKDLLEKEMLKAEKER